MMSIYIGLMHKEYRRGAKRSTMMQVTALSDPNLNLRIRGGFSSYTMVSVVGF